MEKCTFCGYEVPRGTGKMYVKKDGRILWFCSRRCEKNMNKLGRNPRTTTWTVEAKKAKQQMMAAAAHEKTKHAEEPVERKTEKKPAAKKAAKKE